MNFIERFKTKKGIIILIIILIIASFFYISSQKKESITTAVMDQMELKQTNEEKNNDADSDTGIFLEGSDFIVDFQTIYSEKIQIEVKNQTAKQVTLSVTAPDLYTILKQNGDEQKILEILNSNECPTTKNDVKVNYTKEDGKYQIEENEELVNAVYGNALKYFEEMEGE